jgi:hypothetical protein
MLQDTPKVKRAREERLEKEREFFKKRARKIQV